MKVKRTVHENGSVTYELVEEKEPASSLEKLQLEYMKERLELVKKLKKKVNELTK